MIIDRIFREIPIDCVYHIWVVAAIGLCVGAGFFFGAVLVTVLVIIILVLLNKFEKSFHTKTQSK